MSTTLSTTTTPVVSNEAVLRVVTEQEEALEKEWQELQARSQQILEARDAAKAKKKALTHYVANHPPEIQEQQPPAKRRRGQPLAEQIKALIVEKVHEKGELSWAEAAEAYNISRSTVRRVIEAARAHEDRERAVALGEPAPPLPTKKKKGRKPRLTGDELVLILDWIEDNPRLTLKQVVNRVGTELHKTLSKSTIERAFNGLDVSYKELVSIPQKWNTEPVLAARQHFVREQVRDFVGRPLVFVDECAFNMHVVARKGRAVRGEPACLTVLPKQKNQTLIAALSRLGMIYHKFVASRGEAKRGVDADDFRLFLLDLRPHLPEAAVILLDNASIHKAASVDSTFALLRADGFEILFLPPYSPFLNPVEYAFSKVKKMVSKATFHNKEELRLTIAEALPSVSADDARGWFLHMLRFYQQCALGLPFQGKPLVPTLCPAITPPSVAQRHQWEVATSAEAPHALPAP